MSANRRQSKRYEAAVAAEIDVDGEVYPGETRDISAGGVSVVVDAVLQEGQRYKLTLILTHDGIEDPHEEPFEVPAEVTWAAPTESGECLAGLRFVALAATSTARLNRFLAAMAETPHA
jgi:c-di-GMP-binding flagellar brake protein YcgR